MINRYSCYYGTDENPHWHVKAYTHHPSKVNACVRLIKNQLDGPFTCQPDHVCTAKHVWRGDSRHLVIQDGATL